VQEEARFKRSEETRAQPSSCESTTCKASCAWLDASRNSRLMSRPRRSMLFRRPRRAAGVQGLTLVHFSAQQERFV